MEYQDIERKRLIETSEKHKRALTTEFNEISVKTDKLLTNTLIIGGSLALTYFVVSLLTENSSKSKKPKKKKELVDEEQEMEETGSSLLAQLGAKLVDQATLILLDIAKEKLSEYLQSRPSEDLK